MALHSEENRLVLQQRLNWLMFVIVSVFLVMAVRLWQLQIIQGSEFVSRAERNRVRTIQVVAPRGTIADRNNTPLVDNRPAFNALLYRESMKDPESTRRFVVEHLGVRAEDFNSRLRRSRSSASYQPVVIKEDIGIDDITVIETYKREHPELQLGPEPRRFYRYGSNAAHVLGYVGEISAGELEREVFPGAKGGDLVGKAGVERIYNASLTGTDGKRRVLVDSMGREVGLLEEQQSVIGGEIQLTLDLDLQMTAERLLEDKIGSVVAMDPRNGEILVMANAPSYDPNSLSTRISEDDWNELIGDPNSPMQNRAIQNAYPPGSTFKLVLALAGLEEGVVQDTTRVYCNGSAVYYDRTFHCSFLKGHGFMDLEHGISNSCNIYFYELGKKLGISKIAEQALALGLGSKTGIDLPSERSGLVPTPEWKQRVRGTKWFSGETISVSIGQGAVQTTPMQLVRAVSALATGGRLATPHLLLKSERLPQTREWPARQLDGAAENYRRIRDGMWGSVNNYGTGHSAAVEGLDVCGKTGTVQVVGNDRRRDRSQDEPDLETHAWFVGFARRDNPEIAVVVLIEHGGKGGAAAAPIAREIFRAFYAKKYGSPVQLTGTLGRAGE